MRGIREALSKSKRKHTPLGLFGAVVLTAIICHGLHLGLQKLASAIDYLQYIDRYFIVDLIYKYRYSNDGEPLASDGNSLPETTETQITEQSNFFAGVDPERNLYRYPEELRREILNIVNSETCNNSPLEASGDYSVVVCGQSGLIFIFAPSINLEGFGRSMLSILVLDREYQWVFASTTDVEQSPGEGLISIEEHLQKTAIFDWIRKTSALIAVGTASYEGILSEENIRADMRSEEVYALLLSALSKNRIAKSLFRLNLGKYDGNLCGTNLQGGTGYQRPIVIMGVFTGAENPDFLSRRQVQRTVNQLTRRPPPNLSLGCYSNFPNFQVESE